MKAERAETISWQCFGWQRSITPPLPSSSRAPKRVKMPNGSDTAVIDNGSFGTRTIRFETGRLAQQAAGAAVVSLVRAEAATVAPAYLLSGASLKELP